MSFTGYIRRKWFWAHNPELKDMYNEILQILTGGGEFADNKQLISNSLNKLLMHASNTCSFYRDAVSKKADLHLSHFPVIDKTIINNNRNAFLSSTYTAKGTKLHYMHTSGSTGTPFEVVQDMGKRKRVIAEIKATNEIVGFPSHEPMMYLLGWANSDTHRPPYSKKQQFLENIYRKPVALNDEETMLHLADFLKNHNIFAIHSSGSSLQPLLDYIIKRPDLSPSDFKLKIIITGGEMIPPSLKNDVIRAFGKKCKCVVKYSNEEMGILAIDNGPGTPYMLNVANYYFEVLKLDSNVPAGENELGRLVITDLYNYAMPLIRYDTGDLGIIQDRGPNQWPVLIDLHGKRRDLIFTPEGISISGATITNLLKEVKNVKLYQLIQEDCDKYCFKVVPNDATTALSNDDILLNDLQALLGKNAIIRVEITDEIPTVNSQKRRYTVNLYRQS